MGKTTEVLPFTELVERVSQIARSENNPQRVRGAINDIWVRKLPSEEDWTFFLASSAITAVREHDDGTVTINTGDTTAIFASANIGSDMTGRRIKFNENSDIYPFTFVNTTAGTISPGLSEGTNISSGAYKLFMPFYALSDDFDRFPRNGGLLLYQGGKIKVIPEKATQGYFSDYNHSPGTPEFCRLVTFGTTGVPHVEIIPPPSKSINLPYEYLKRPEVLRDTTAGFVTIDAGSTSVTGSAGTTRFTEASTGWWIRIDAFGKGADSEWYKVATITHNSSLTLMTAFGLSGATTAAYTLSPAPDVPAKMHPAILYGAAATVIADQNDPLFKLYEQKYRETVTDGKRMYKSRIYNQEVETVLEDYNFRR